MSKMRLISFLWGFQFEKYNSNEKKKDKRKKKKKKKFLLILTENHLKKICEAIICLIGRI